MLFIFFIIKFLLPSLLFCKPLRNMLQFNQEPSWLPRYRHLAFSIFVSLLQITHESKISSWLKDSDIIHKILEQATPFFPLFHQLRIPIWKYWPPQAFNKSMGRWILLCRISSYRIPKTICNTTWMNLCPNLVSAHDSLKNRNLKKYFLFHDNPIIKKKKKN